MTQPLNFTTKAVADIVDMARVAPNEARRKGLLFVADRLRRAEVFVLPNKGHLIDRSKPYPEVAGSVFHPPFPIVALEYQASEPDWQPTSVYNAVASSRRIALAWEYDGSGPLGRMPGDIEPGEGFAVASIAYFDHLRRWAPVFGAVVTRYDAAYSEVPDSDLRDALIRDRRINPALARGRALDSRHILPLLPDALAAQVQQFGAETAINAMSADLMDEMNAYRDLCLALACNNVVPVRHTQDAKLNKSRIRMGRPPLKDFHVLEIASRSGASDGTGLGTGVRSHLRRGHIRRLGPEKLTWVNACMVRGSRPGFVDKQYAPAAQAGAAQ